jgi:uncharacterized protein YkwD
MFKNNTKTSIIVVISSIIACVISTFVFFSIISKTNDFKAVQSTEFYTIEQFNISINKQRIEKKIKPLKLNPLLIQSANEKALDMGKKGYFSHISPIDGTKWSDFINKSGYDYQQAGENLANGFTDINEIVTAWMNSPSHRENILNPEVDETGFGYYFGKLNGAPTIFVVQVFGKQASE